MYAMLRNGAHCQFGPSIMSITVDSLQTNEHRQNFGPHLTLHEAADFLRLSTRTCQRLMETGQFPTPIRLSQRRIVFARSDLLAWVQSRKRGHDASKIDEA
jgi:predicted DNA-binding transcriptional regulator AlpA